MKFQEFLHEVTLDTAGVRLKKEGDNYIYPFSINKVSYRLVFRPFFLEIGGTYGRLDSWNIDFEGPRGLDLTGLGNATAVYSKMLSGLKAFVEQINPDGVHLKGRTYGMDLMYQKIFERFGGNFVRIGEQDYIRKDIYEQLDANTRWSVDRKKNIWDAGFAAWTQKRRDDQQQQRSNRIELNNHIGEFYIPTGSTTWEWILAVDPVQYKILSCPQIAITTKSIEEFEGGVQWYRLEQLPPEIITKLTERLIRGKAPEAKQVPTTLLAKLKQMSSGKVKFVPQIPQTSPI